MQGKRLFHTIRLWTLSNAGKRAEYLKNHHVFAEIGDNCSYMGRVVPLFPNLIRFGNNVHVSSNVLFITHDGIHAVLNGASKDMSNERKHLFQEYIGCIEVGSNVFIGARSIVCYNVRIGNNVIITAGSIVTNDVPSNSVVRGVPAKVVCSFEQYYDMKSVKQPYPSKLKPNSGRVVGSELEKWLWDDFYCSRKIEC